MPKQKETHVQDGLPEAANSANFLMVDPMDDTWVQFTFRRRTREELMEEVKLAKAELATAGWLSRHQWEQQVGSYQQTPTQPTANGGQARQGDDTFEATAIEKSFNNNKWYFKVKGVEGRFPKFPVTVWPDPEVFDPAGLDEQAIIQHDGDWPLPQGTVARYVRNENNNPSKVVALQVPGVTVASQADPYPEPEPQVPPTQQPQSDMPAGWPQFWNEVSKVTRDYPTIDALKEAVGGDIDFSAPVAVQAAYRLVTKKEEVPF